MPRESGDRTLMAFYENVTAYAREILDGGFDDLPELSRKLAGLREEIETLERKAESIADEQAERMADEHDAGWVTSFNGGVEWWRG